MPYRKLFFAAVILLLGGVCAGLFAINKLGGWKYTAHRLHTLEAWPTYTQRLSQLEMLPIDSGDVVFIGDSHIAFGEWQDWLAETPIANRGIPGEGIEGLRAFAKTQDLKMARMLVVQIGTNDLLFHEVGEVITYYEELIDQLNQLGIPVIYCTLPGVNNEVRWTGIKAKDVEVLNDFIRSISGKTNEILDLSKVLGTDKGVLPEGLTDDGVHLRGEGYRMWKSEIDRNLNRVGRY